MDIRVLKYFLAVNREGSISRAADVLHITQPNLSRQLQNLEKEIGKPLFIRGNRRMVLTETGLLLRKRAEEIVELCEKTESELQTPTTELSGNIVIGGGESYAVQLIAKAVKRMQERHPHVQFHFYSSDTNDVMEKLDNGLIDFGILIEPADLSRYSYLRLPLTDTWGILMRKDSPLAGKDSLTPEDLWDVPLIRSKHSLGEGLITDWFRCDSSELNIVATYTLIYNASLLVEEGVGYAVGLDGLINTTGESCLCFRPFSPRLESYLDIAWKKYQVFPKVSQVFLELLAETFQEEDSSQRLSG